MLVFLSKPNTPAFGLVEVYKSKNGKANIGDLVFSTRKAKYLIPGVKSYYNRKAERLAKEIFDCNIVDYKDIK